MKKLLKLSVLVLIALFLFAGCDWLFGPSKEDVAAAFAALSRGITAANTGTPTISGNTMTFPGTGGASLAMTLIMDASFNLLDGSKMDVTFSNWNDTTSGYTINGSFTITLTGTQTAMVQNCTGSITLSGGTITTLAMNYSANTATQAVTGTITANGHDFNVADL